MSPVQEQWRKVIRRLLALGAITELDVDAPIHQSRTPGQRLLSDLAYWGDLKAAQLLADDAIKARKDYV